MTRPINRLALPFAALMLLTACGGDDATDAPAAATDPAESAVAEAAAPAVADAGLAPLDVASLDALVRGIERENTMLTSVAERMPGAADDMAKIALMSEVEPAKLEAEGASAAGLEVEHYRHVKDQLFTVVGVAEMRATMEQQFAGLDTSGMDEAAAAQAKQNAEEMRAQLSDPYADLDAATADAMRARQAELAELRARHIGLLFKAAGG